MAREITIVALAIVAVGLTVYLARHHVGPKPPGKAPIADNQEMHRSADDEIVGCSNVMPDPVSRISLANTRFMTGPLGMPMLRQTSKGRHMPVAQILNFEGQHG